MRRPLQLVSSASVLLAAVALLAGCTPPAPEPTPTPTAAPSETATPTPTPEPSETATAGPVDIACDVLITPQAMYDFNPNFTLIASWSPAPGSAAQVAIDLEGQACRWQNDTSGDTIDVSVAALDEATLAAKQAEASAGSSAPYGWFRVVDGAGEATAFHGTYWVVVRSVWFVGPGDANRLVETVLSAL